MFANQFRAIGDGVASVSRVVQPQTGLSFHGVVGNIVGKKWVRVKTLKKDFEQAFPGFTFSVEYNDGAFFFTLPAIPAAVYYLNTSIGVEIALANEAIHTNPEFVGAVIGKGGKGLRAIENRVGNNCTVYFDSGAFYVKFLCDTPASERISTMSVIRESIYGHAVWLEERLSDASSSNVSIETASSGGSEKWSGKSPTPSEAFSN